MQILEISKKEYEIGVINSIKKKYPELRQESKNPTFALTYQGMYITLMNNCGFSEKKAKFIEAQYHALYSESDKWVQDKLKQASLDGYIEGAFKLRLRTPVLSQVVFGNHMPYKASEEGRTAGNMLGQSWGMLNLRALFKFMELVWESEYKYVIQPICSIHDANYFLTDNTLGCIEFVNNNLIKVMQWQNLPEIQHDVVKLGGNLDIFYPDWSKPTTLPNYASRKEILNICNNPKD